MYDSDPMWQRSELQPQPTACSKRCFCRSRHVKKASLFVLLAVSRGMTSCYLFQQYKNHGYNNCIKKHLFHTRITVFCTKLMSLFHSNSLNIFIWINSSTHMFYLVDLAGYSRGKFDPQLLRFLQGSREAAQVGQRTHADQAGSLFIRRLKTEAKWWCFDWKTVNRTCCQRGMKLMNGNKLTR